MDESALMDCCDDLTENRSISKKSHKHMLCECAVSDAVRCEKTCSMYCRSCGTVLYQLNDTMQPGIYGINGKGIAPRYGNVTDKNFPTSSLGTNINGFSHLKRAHQWTNSNQEKSLKDKRKKITQVCKNYNIPTKIMNLACDLYMRIHENKHRDGIRRGRPLIGRMAACVGCAAKHYNFAMSEDCLIQMFFVSDSDNKRVKKNMTDTKVLNDIIGPFRPYVRKGMTYLLDLLFYETSNHADSEKTTGMKRIETVCCLVKQYGTALGFDPVRCRVAQWIAKAIHKTKRDKDKQNKTFVSTCLVMTNDRYPLSGQNKKRITRHCGSTPGAINSFQKSILNYLFKKFQFDIESIDRKLNTRDQIFDSLYPAQKDIDTWRIEESAGIIYN